VVRRATMLNPAERYRNAAELRSALQATIPVTDRPMARTRRLMAQSPQRALLGVAALLIVPLLLSQMLLRAATGAPYYYEQQPDGYGAPPAYQNQNIDPFAPARTAVGPPTANNPQYAQCNLTVAQYTKPRTDYTCGADNAVWFIDAPNNQLDRVLPNGTVSPFPIPAPASVMTTITAGPGGSPGAESLWLTGTSAAVVYVRFDGPNQIRGGTDPMAPSTGMTTGGVTVLVRHVGGAAPVVPIGTTQNGGLRFVQPSDGSTGIILPDGTVVRPTTSARTAMAPAASSSGTSVN
jgi:hypothetical protein